MVELVVINGTAISAAINPFGAELTWLRDSNGDNWMTDGDPAFWSGHAPLLFPIVGRLNGDVLRLDGVEYPMKQHGFARRQMFELVEHDASHARFRLTANAETRAQYPFDFVLEASFTIHSTVLTVDIRIANPGDVPLPASFGFHPAFAWPLPDGGAREEHVIGFDSEEGDIVRLADGLILERRRSPLDGQLLHLNDALFAEDALVWTDLQSQKVIYSSQEAQLEIEFPDTPCLGIWSKPGARFVCIEPWHGHADPAGFTGDFRDKPEIFEVEPGEDWTCTMRVTLRP